MPRWTPLSAFTAIQLPHLAVSAELRRPPASADRTAREPIAIVSVPSPCGGRRVPELVLMFSVYERLRR